MAGVYVSTTKVEMGARFLSKILPVLTMAIGNGHSY
jgi:hypothetical protein